MSKKCEMMKLCFFYLSFVGLNIGAILSCSAFADGKSEKDVVIAKIYLGNGRTDKGAIIKETEGELKLDNVLSIITYPKNRIKSIERETMKPDSYRIWRGDFWAAKMLDYRDDKGHKHFINAASNAIKEYKLALLENPYQKAAQKKLNDIKIEEDEWLKTQVMNLNNEREEWKARTSKLDDKKLTNEESNELKNNSKILDKMMADSKEYGQRANSVEKGLNQLAHRLDRNLRAESREIERLRLELLLIQRGYGTFYYYYIREHPSDINKNSPLGHFLSQFGR